MSHVVAERTTVYRAVACRRRYLTKYAAYYNAAKRLIVAKYPPIDLYQDEDFGVDPDRVDAICERRESLFFSDGGFDSELWQRFVRRVARFLRYRDQVEAEEDRAVLRGLLEMLRVIATAVALDEQIKAWRAPEARLPTPCGTAVLRAE